MTRQPLVGKGGCLNSPGPPAPGSTVPRRAASLSLGLCGLTRDPLAHGERPLSRSVCGCLRPRAASSPGLVLALSSDVSNSSGFCFLFRLNFLLIVWGSLF